MNWYRRTTADANNTMLQRHLDDVVQLGLSPEFGRLPAVPTRWPKGQGRGTGSKPKRKRMMEGKEPAAQQANLPTDAVGNSPDGTGKGF